MRPELLWVAPDQLVANPWNSNEVSPENEAKLEESLRRFGTFKPLVVRERPEGGPLEILGGEHRWLAARRIGLEQVPVMNLGLIDDVKAKEISIADNSRYGADDPYQLAAVLESLKDEQLTDFLPYTDTDLSAIFSSVDIALDDLEGDGEDEETEPEVKATKAPKTHAIMRFKVALGDQDKITRLIEKTQKKFGFTAADELTNAGDALVHHLLGDEDAEA
jgi:ParB-like chromosome segregation protein Spo0J